MTRLGRRHGVAACRQVFGDIAAVVAGGWFSDNDATGGNRNGRAHDGLAGLVNQLSADGEAVYAGEVNAGSVGRHGHGARGGVKSEASLDRRRRVGIGREIGGGVSAAGVGGRLGNDNAARGNLHAHAADRLTSAIDNTAHDRERRRLGNEIQCLCAGWHRYPFTAWKQVKSGFMWRDLPCTCLQPQESVATVTISHNTVHNTIFAHIYRDTCNWLPLAIAHHPSKIGKWHWQVIALPDKSHHGAACKAIDERFAVVAHLEIGFGSGRIEHQQHF